MDLKNQVGNFSCSADVGYTFLEPGVIYSGQMPERQAKLLLGWLRQWLAMIYHLTFSSLSAWVLSNQNWHTMLTYGETLVLSETQEQTRNAHCCVDMHQLLGNCLDKSGLELVLSRE